MTRIAVVTDSGGDLTPEQLQQYSIIEVPLVVRFGNEQYLENELTVEQYWHKVLNLHQQPETSQPPTGLFEEVFSSLFAQGFDHIICAVITSKHSGTYNSAHAAAQSFPGRVTVWDTLSLSVGEGYQAIQAAIAAREGKSLQEILALLEDIRSRTHILILFDSLEFLRKGGRADRIMPILDGLARVLNIKVLVKLGPDGELKPLGAVRSRDKGIVRIVQEVEQRMPATAMGVLHIRCAPDAERVANRLAERTGFPRDQMMVGEAGVVLGSHGGPGVVATMVVGASG